MKNNKTLFLILLLLPLLTGCWSLPMRSTTPGEYSESINTVESIYPLTQEDIITQLGEPDWVEKRDSSTYFIYRLEESTEHFVIFLILIPFIVGSESDVTCLFLGFDEASNLVNHAWVASQGDHPSTCINEFYRKRPDTSPYCRNANTGRANAQKYIGDLYYLTYYNFFEKDLVSAYVWYSLAANSGHKGAAEQVDTLTPELSPEQLSKAKIRLEEWKPDYGLSNWRCH